MRRRDFIAGGLAAATAGSGPVSTAIAQSTNFTPVPRNRFIDAHCHLFNVLDVPAESFIKKIVLPNVVKTMGAGSTDYAQLFTKYQDTFAVMLHLLSVAVSRRACDPDDEIATLDEMERVGTKPRDAKAVEIALLNEIVNQVWWPTKVQQGMKVGEVFVTFYALNQIKYLLRKEAFPDMPEEELRAEAANQASDCEYAASQLYHHRNGVFSRAIRWGLLFTRYRFQLAEELQRLHGGRARLLTPALVDFGAWFGPPANNAADRTVPMRRQAEVMARIARRKNGPRVHGFVGFDPLRQALFRAQGGLPLDEPMAVVRKAVEEHGFVGVKLYPPMGFRPTGNTELGNDFPAHVRSARDGLGPAPGAKLDAALDELYAWCTANNVPVMAHTSNSYGSALNYGTRADPAGWIKVLQKYPTLRLNMAHLGGFNRDGDRQHPERSWGWTIGRMFGQAATPNVYTDISFFSEVLQHSADQRRYLVWLFKKFIEQFPKLPERLIYGTDWTMIGYVPNFPSLALEGNKERVYPEMVVNFLANDVGFTPEQVDAVMFRNAARYLGLGPDQGAQSTRGRLEQFYLRAGLSSAWMQEFDSV